MKVTFSPAIAVDGDAVNDPAAACCAEAGTDTVTRPVTSAGPGEQRDHPVSPNRDAYPSTFPHQ